MSNLNEAEKAAAKAAGISEDRYAAMQGRTSFDDWKGAKDAEKAAEEAAKKAAKGGDGTLTPEQVQAKNAERQALADEIAKAEANWK